MEFHIYKMIKLFYKNSILLNKDKSILINLFSKWIYFVYDKVRVYKVFLNKFYFKATHTHAKNFSLDFFRLGLKVAIKATLLFCKQFHIIDILQDQLGNIHCVSSPVHTVNKSGMSPCACTTILLFYPPYP